MKHLLVAVLLIVFVACQSSSKNNTISAAKEAEEKIVIENLLDSFNAAAGRADYEGYFNFYTDDAIFAGTDATERWDKAAFMEWAKPIFARGKAWNFSALQRNVYLNKTGDIGWFDELLNTQMKICRGSGVLVKQDGGWKVQQYILSMTLPNDLIDTILALKAPAENKIIDSLLNQ